MAAITAVSFDADGTLWDFVGVMRRSLERCLALMATRWNHGGNSKAA